VESQRCIHIPTDRDICPGRITVGPHCQTQGDCLKLAESVFTVSFPEMDEGYSGEVNPEQRFLTRLEKGGAPRGRTGERLWENHQKKRSRMIRKW
jgi:hypothetical protein